jgi:uncharacterized membrane protein
MYNIIKEVNVAKEKHHHSSGLLFPAFLFLGFGIGWAFGHAGIGILTGMGIGFFAMALIRVKSEPWEIKLPCSSAGYFIFLIGALLIVIGVGLIFFPEKLYPYIIGVFIALFGVGFIILAGKSIKHKEKK